MYEVYFCNSEDLEYTIKHLDVLGPYELLNMDASTQQIFTKYFDFDKGYTHKEFLDITGTIISDNNYTLAGHLFSIRAFPYIEMSSAAINDYLEEKCIIFRKPK